MKVGDLVKFRGEDENEEAAAKGLLVEIRPSVCVIYGVMWDFLNGQIGWQNENDIEVISESR